MCYGLFLLSKKEIQKEIYSKTAISLLTMKLNTDRDLSNNYPYNYLIMNNSCSCDLVSSTAAHDPSGYKRLREELLDILKQVNLSVANFALINHNFQGYFDEELVKVNDSRKVYTINSEFLDSLQPDILYKVISYQW